MYSSESNTPRMPAQPLSKEELSAHSLFCWALQETPLTPGRKAGVEFPLQKSRGAAQWGGEPLIHTGDSKHHWGKRDFNVISAHLFQTGVKLTSNSKHWVKAGRKKKFKLWILSWMLWQSPQRSRNTRVQSGGKQEINFIYFLNKGAPSINLKYYPPFYLKAQEEVSVYQMALPFDMQTNNK